MGKSGNFSNQGPRVDLVPGPLTRDGEQTWHLQVEGGPTLVESLAAIAAESLRRLQVADPAAHRALVADAARAVADASKAERDAAVAALAEASSEGRSVEDTPRLLTLAQERDAAVAREAALRSAIAAVVQATVWEDGPQEDGTWSQDAAACVHPAALVPLPGMLADPTPAAKRQMKRVAALERFWRAREADVKANDRFERLCAAAIRGYASSDETEAARRTTVAASEELEAAEAAVRALEAPR